MALEESGGGEKGEAKVDLSGYPENLDEWSGQNFIDYFTETGVFYDGDGAETWLQDHEDYWPGTPVRECAAYKELIEAVGAKEEF